MLIGITGSSGFVGSHLCNFLGAKRYQIYKFSRKELANIENCKKTDVIIHLAGKAHDLKNTSDSDDYYKINFELTRQIFDSFLQSDTQSFIFVSSVKAVADSVETVLTEETVPEPQTDYGKSKLLAERYIQSKVLPKGKFCYILRPCMIHGPGNKGNLNLLYKLVQKGIPYPLGAFDNRRSFLSIENLCFIIDELIKNSFPSGVYNVADDEALSTNSIVELIGQSMGKRIRVLAIPRKIIFILAKIGGVMHLPFNSHQLKKLTDNYIVSNSKIKNAINKKFPLNSRQGLTYTFKYFNKNDR